MINKYLKKWEKLDKLAHSLRFSETDHGCVMMVSYTKSSVQYCYLLMYLYKIKMLSGMQL